MFEITRGVEYNSWASEQSVRVRSLAESIINTGSFPTEGMSFRIYPNMKAIQVSFRNSEGATVVVTADYCWVERVQNDNDDGDNPLHRLLSMYVKIGINHGMETLLEIVQDNNLPHPSAVIFMEQYHSRPIHLKILDNEKFDVLVSNINTMMALW